MIRPGDVATWRDLGRGLRRGLVLQVGTPTSAVRCYDTNCREQIVTHWLAATGERVELATQPSLELPNPHLFDFEQAGAR